MKFHRILAAVSFAVIAGQANSKSHYGYCIDQNHYNRVSSFFTFEATSDYPDKVMSIKPSITPEGGYKAYDLDLVREWEKAAESPDNGQCLVYSDRAEAEAARKDYLKQISALRPVTIGFEPSTPRGGKTAAVTPPKPKGSAASIKIKQPVLTVESAGPPQAARSKKSTPAPVRRAAETKSVTAPSSVGRGSNKSKCHTEGKRFMCPASKQ